MDAELSIATAPFRDPRYAPRQLVIEERPGGEVILTNPRPQPHSRQVHARRNSSSLLVFRKK